MLYILGNFLIKRFLRAYIEECVPLEKYKHNKSVPARKNQQTKIIKYVLECLKFGLPFPVRILIQCCGDIETNPGPLDVKAGKTNRSLY